MNIEIFFNRPGQPIPIKRIIDEVRAAREMLIVASAWFTATEIAQAVIDAPAADKLIMLNASDVGRGNKRAYGMIRDYCIPLMIAAEEEHNRRAREWNARRRAWYAAHPPEGGDVFGPPSVPFPEDEPMSLSVHPRVAILGSRDWQQGVMHHKFIVIDWRVVYHGSYNFTFQAQHNYETLARIEDPGIARQFTAEAAAIAEGYQGAARENERCVVCETELYPDEVIRQNYGDAVCATCNKGDI